MVNKTPATTSAGRHQASGRRRRANGSPNALITAFVLTVLTVMAVVAAPATWRGAWAVASPGGPTPAGDGEDNVDHSNTGDAAMCGPRPEASAATAGGGAAGGCSTTADILVTLRWDNNNDEDLHVTEPDGTEIAYYAPGPTASGGRLDRDDEVGMCGTEDGTTGDENVTWAAWTDPAPGTYRVRIEEFSACSEAGPAPARWTLQVRIHGRVVQDHAGTTEGSTPRRTVAEFDFDYPGDTREPAVESVAGDANGETPATEPDQAVQGARTLGQADVTRACAAQHGDPSATAEVRDVSSIPAHRIRCVSAEGEDLGGVSLDDYCAETYPGTLSYNPDRDAPDAWEHWQCR